MTTTLVDAFDLGYRAKTDGDGPLVAEIGGKTDYLYRDHA